MKLTRLISLSAMAITLLISDFSYAQTTVTIGEGTSSSSTRGPFQRSDTASSTVFSRFVHIYTADELSDAGIPEGVMISSLNWELASSNVIIGDGVANLKVYMRNSTATEATVDTWENLIDDSDLVVDEDYGTSNNFPGENGWMSFEFNSDWEYEGDAIEIAVDWDCSGLSTPAFSGDGALKWRWESVEPDFLVVKKTSSSGPSSNITDLKDERANIQIVYSEQIDCESPSDLEVNNITTNSADFAWEGFDDATGYGWVVVLAGSGSAGDPVDEGETEDTFVSTSSLSPLTAYDFFVESDCDGDGSGFAGPYSFSTLPEGQQIATIGMGTSSSSTRGPFHRSDTTSSTVFSRFVQIYTADELAAAGIESGTSLNSVGWELASSNVIIGDGDANMKVYARNTSTTEATPDSWDNYVDGAAMVVDMDFNTSNNFPGENGWMSFAFSSPYVYTGGSLEIAVDWDCSQVSIPAFSGNGAIKWRWESTEPNVLVVKKTASSSSPSDLEDTSNERANIQFGYAGEAAPCQAPTGLSADNITDTAADLNWAESVDAQSYNWVVVLAGEGAGGTPVDSGSESTNAATTANLVINTSYDLFVQAECSDSEMSDYAGPYSFMTTNSVGIDQIDYLTNLLVSPNPSNGITNLNIELSQSANVGVDVFSMNGKQLASVYQGRVSQLKLPIDLTAYENGLYFIRVSIDGYTTTKRIVYIK